MLKSLFFLQICLKNKQQRNAKKIQIEYLCNKNGIFHLAVAEHTEEIVSPIHSCHELHTAYYF